MKADKNIFEDGFESWVRAKRFADLNEDELQILRSEGIDEAAYSEIRSMLLALDSIEDEPNEKATPALKDKLMEAFDRGPQKENRRGLIFWIGGIGLAAAAAILLFFYVLPGPQHDKTEIAIRQSDETPNSERKMHNRGMKMDTTNPVEHNQTKSSVIDLKQEVLKEDIPLGDERNIVEKCSGLPPSEDLVSEAPAENADDYIAGSSLSGTLSPAVNLHQSTIEKIESKSKGNDADNQHLTTAMIDWLVTVY